MIKKNINIGVLAHVDAGKTTLTEHFLYNSGIIKTVGSVDKGSTITDSLTLEKERGISIKAANTSFEWLDTNINLIDTPGHVDFSSEVERVLCVLDAAILVLSAVEGVQAHTLNIWESLKKMEIPTIIFINKIDRHGASLDNTISQIEQDLNIKPIILYDAINEGLPDANIKALFVHSDKETILKEKSKENILDIDENLLEHFLNSEKITDKQYIECLKKQKYTNNIIPVFCGIAKSNIGVKELLNGIIDFLPNSNINNSENLSAYVFKLEHNKLHGVMAHVKIFSGQLKSKAVVFNTTQQIETKINQTKILRNNKYVDNVILTSGDIGVITGVMGTKAGDILGASKFIPNPQKLSTPVLSVEVVPENISDYNPLSQALIQIDKEDPSLQFKWYKAEKELQLLLVGKMQIEILTYVLLERFNLKVQFKEPKIIYKETINNKSEGYIRYWMPKPCWAIMTFLIEPAPLNSGVTYSSIVSQNDIHIKYQNEIARTIPKALNQGLLGWEVTDVKITLVKGEDHNIHSRPGDFNLATPMGIMKGLKLAGTHLLEPVLMFEIKANEEYLGQITSEISTRRGTFETPFFKGNSFKLTGKIPAENSTELGVKLNSITSGKIRLNLNFYGYEKCPDGIGKSKPFKGVNPLDEAQWILHRRGAYKANERN